MPASTLALGGSSYQLLDLLENELPTGIKASGTSTVGISATTKSPIEGLAVSGTGIAGSVANGSKNNNLNINSSLTDFQADMGDGNDIINIFGSVDGAQNIVLGSDNDKLMISQNLNSAHVNSGSGKDDIRVNGSVSETVFLLDSDSDSLVIGNSGKDVRDTYINAGSGNDYIEIRGIANNVIVQGDDGDDNILFRDELYGSEPGVAGVELGAGNDRLNLGNGSTNGGFNTGIGTDTVTLKGSFQNSSFINDGGRDQFTIAQASGFFDSEFVSNSTQGDVLTSGKGVQFADTFFDFGTGNDNMVFGGEGTNFYQSQLFLDEGADFASFGSNSTFSDFNIYLGDDSAIDTIKFADNNWSDDQVVISGAGKGDILYIGSDVYYYEGTGHQAGSGWMAAWGSSRTS